MTKYADIRIDITVAFEDNGDEDLRDQAMEAANDHLSGIWMPGEVDAEVIGPVRETELPAQERAA